MEKPRVTLTAKQQLVAELKAAGMTRAEIAAELGLTVNSVKVHLQRARRRAVAQQPALQRYRDALSRGGKPVKFKPFSLLPGEA